MLNLTTEAAIEEQRNAYSFVLAGLARLAGACDTLDESVRSRLRNVAAQRGGPRKNLLSAFHDYLKRPVELDTALVEVAHQFSLESVEILAVSLAVAVEQDLLISHLLSHLQQPLALSRPTIGLVAQAFAPSDFYNAVHVLGQGNASQCGLLQLCGEDRPLPERQLRVPLPSVLALQNRPSSWPGTALIAFDQHPVPLGRTADTRAAGLAKRLSESGDSGPALIIRSGDGLEARAAAVLVCTHALVRPVLIHTDQVLGMAPWLTLNRLLPVFAQWLTPGERKPVATIPGFAGPVIYLTGPEGEFESDEHPIIDWRLETPSVIERAELWSNAIGESALARRLAAEHRHAAGRIATLGAKAREDAGGRSTLVYADIRAVSRRGDSVGLGALAELIRDEVDDQSPPRCAMNWNLWSPAAGCANSFRIRLGRRFRPGTAPPCGHFSSARRVPEKLWPSPGWPLAWEFLFFVSILQRSLPNILVKPKRISASCWLVPSRMRSCSSLTRLTRSLASAPTSRKPMTALPMRRPIICCNAWRATMELPF
jgi:hypothetical protein